MKSLLSIFIMLQLTILVSCSNDWLEERSNKSLVVPNSLNDLQALLDNTDYMNGNHLGGGVLPDMGENGSDDYLLSDNVWNNMNVVYKNAYIWNSDIFEGYTSLDWNRPYLTVFYANTVLDELMNIEPAQHEINEFNNIKGSALFYRANAFFHLAQVFARPYSRETAEEDLGIALRLTSDFNVITTRASISDTYSRILEDLDEALILLPDRPLYKTRPSKAAVYGLRARLYLVMGDYENALANAEACLALQDDLMNFNSINVTANLPFPRFGIEIVFDASIVSNLAMQNHIVSPELYDLYDLNDLRRTAYFRVVSGNLKFKGSYIRSQFVFFGGIATDEIYLIKAECHARLNDIPIAMSTLDLLLENRYIIENGISSYSPFQPSSQSEAIDIILNERRKELPFRGLRWMDLRRLNGEGRNIVLRRVVNGMEYLLEPNSPKYIYPIPNDVINASGIQQNVR